MKTISILLIDNSPLFKFELESILSQKGLQHLLKNVLSGDEALELLQKERFDIVLMDLDALADRDNRLLDSLSRAVGKTNSRLIVMSSRAEEGLLKRTYGYGIDGYILKNTLGVEVAKAVELVLEGSQYYSKEIVPSLFNVLVKKMRPSAEAKAQLSEQEKKVLYYICMQWSNKEIAKELSLSENTIMRHKQNIKEKIGAKNLVGYVTYALKHNIVRLTDV